MKGRNTGKWRVIALALALGGSFSPAHAQSCTAAGAEAAVGFHLSKLPRILHAPGTPKFSGVFLLPLLPAPASGARQVSAPLPWKADDLPFFCRIEYHLGKRAQVPFKFRLGSVEYVDWLEGKPGNAGYWPN